MAWLVAGVVVKLCCKGFIYGGLGWIIMTGLCIWLMDGHVELALILWMIYLPLIVVYSASHIGKRRGAWVNFIFHGIFLAMVIVGGILAKIELWSKAGGWTAWSARMREGYLPWFLVFLTLALIASLGIKKEHEEE